MYHIAICEDDKIFADNLNNICNQICEKANINCEITVFKSGVDFLENFLTEPQKFDLLLLDIVLKEDETEQNAECMNGIDLAKTIRKKNGKFTIIFVTCNRDFAIQGYEVQAMYYLLKPVDIHVLESLILTDYKNRFNKIFVVLKSGAEIEKLPFNEIIALEISSRKVAIYLHNKTFYYSGRLVELMEQFPENIFVRCHQSFVLNIKNIYEIKKNNAFMVDGKIIPISRKYMKDIQQLFLDSMNNL